MTPPSLTINGANNAPEARQRLFDLLCDRATSGLSLSETLELDALATDEPAVDLDVIERLAAELSVAIDRARDARDTPPMPASLKTKLYACADRCASPIRSAIHTESPAPSLLRHPAAGWWTAAAAILVAAISLAFAGFPNDARRSGDAAADFRERLAAASDVQTFAWADNATGIRGDIVWSTDQQSGYLRLTGLPRNNPETLQYQLWIFDAVRDARGESMHAVDGGVFDAPLETQGEILIPIRPALKVFEPALFAITSEPPGGVIRHDPALDPDRYRILVTASVSDLPTS